MRLPSQHCRRQAGFVLLVGSRGGAFLYCLTGKPGIRLTGEESQQQAVQPQRPVSFRFDQPQPFKARDSVLHVSFTNIVVVCLRRAQQQPARHRLAGCTTGQGVQQKTGQPVAGRFRVKPVHAQGEGPANVQLMSGRRPIARLQRAMFQQLRAPQRGQIVRRPAKAGMPVTRQVAGRHVQRQWQVTERAGNGVEVRIVRGKVGPEAIQQRDALRP